MLHSQEPNYRRSAAELEEEELSVGLLKRQIQIIWGLQQDWRRQGSSVLDGCVLWGASMVVLPPGKERVIHELCKIHVHPGIGRMKRLARSRVWWASLNGDLEAKVQTCTKCQSSRPPELISCPDPLAQCHVRKRVWYSECHMGRGSSLIWELESDSRIHNHMCMM